MTLTLSTFLLTIPARKFLFRLTASSFSLILYILLGLLNTLKLLASFLYLKAEAQSDGSAFAFMLLLGSAMLALLASGLSNFSAFNRYEFTQGFKLRKFIFIPSLSLTKFTKKGKLCEK